jgi:hypothetical protein
MAKRTVTSLGLLVLALQLLSPSSIMAQTISDDEIAAILIAGSRFSYTGPCPCPYDLDRRGWPCGDRSAYSKPGGAEPLCYREDVTPEMIDEIRQNKQ